QRRSPTSVGVTAASTIPDDEILRTNGFPAPPKFTTVGHAHEFVRALREILWASMTTAAAAAAVGSSEERTHAMGIAKRNNNNNNNNAITNTEETKYSFAGEPSPSQGVHTGGGDAHRGPSPTAAIIRDAVCTVVDAHNPYNGEGNGENYERNVEGDGAGKRVVSSDHLSTHDEGAL
ncbi:unnamed protein product, partial [Sphacelaria rigidula]